MADDDNPLMMTLLDSRGGFNSSHFIGSFTPAIPTLYIYKERAYHAISFRDFPFFKLGNPLLLSVHVVSTLSQCVTNQPQKVQKSTSIALFYPQFLTLILFYIYSLSPYQLLDQVDINFRAGSKLLISRL